LAHRRYSVFDHLFEDCPDHWQIMRLGELVTTQYGLSINSSPRGTTPMVGMQHIQDGQLLLRRVPKVALSPALVRQFALRPGDILFNRTNSADQVGKVAVVRRRPKEPTVFASYLVRLRCTTGRVNPAFLSYWMNSDLGAYQLRRLATPGVSQYNINPTALCAGFLVALPPTDEQTRIVEVIDEWRNTRKLVRRLMRALHVYERGLLQRLYDPQVESDRLFPTRRETLSRLMTESRVRGSSGLTAKKLTVKLYGRGVVPNNTREGSHRTQYYRRSTGQFLYSKLDFLNGAFGIIPGELDGYETTLDLPAFDLSPNLHPYWLLYFMSRPDFYRRQTGLANGGRKARRVNPRNLLQVEIDVPPLAIQRIVASLLGSLRRQRTLLELEVALLRLQERALLKQLLGGQLEVPSE
jgi:type I restriction enzyme S subunit